MVRKFKETATFNPVTRWIAGMMETGEYRDATYKAHMDVMFNYCGTVTQTFRDTPHTAQSFAPKTKEEREFHGYQATTSAYGALQKANSLDAVIAFCDTKKEES